jgi:hypothetical protein
MRITTAKTRPLGGKNNKIDQRQGLRKVFSIAAVCVKLLRH